jgi:hypothetical protein
MFKKKIQAAISAIPEEKISKVANGSNSLLKIEGFKKKKDKTNDEEEKKKKSEE